MASVLASLQLSSPFVQKPNTLFGNHTPCAATGFGFAPKVGQNRIFTFVVKATGETESSASISIVKSVQNVWERPEDRVAVIGLGFATVVAIWASINLVGAIDKLPIVPSTLEFIGILFSAWFTYRYLLFKPDREELFRNINKSISDVLGQ
ncbi:hypothetical protein MLD38_029628 [Melastoma candidum]|uniref:Uncharacterized protein n=1 Tax=Melastoma candidum TaxID=119954 RepID=A0ACB9N8H7_9MYRT|nr:hypothetical protein MLD38_029628 [Melastoma candidum]